MRKIKINLLYYLYSKVEKMLIRFQQILLVRLILFRGILMFN